MVHPYSAQARLDNLAGPQNVTPPLSLPAVEHPQSVIVYNVVEIGETTSRCRPATGFVGLPAIPVP
jgi:hypothetical protein